MTSLDIRGICSAGGNVTIDAEQFTILDLRGIAMAAKYGNCKVTIKHAFRLTALSCRGIAMAGGNGTVTFDFTE